MGDTPSPGDPSEPLPSWREGYNPQELELLPILRSEVASMRGLDHQGADSNQGAEQRQQELQLLPDHFLIRWLRARSHSVPRALQMLRAYYDWRDEHDFPACIDPEHYTTPAVVESDLTVRFLGEDDLHRPVIWAPVGRWHVRLLLEQGLKEQLVLFVYSLFQRVLDRIEQARTDHGVVQVVAILDMAELSWAKLSLDTLQSTTRFFREFEAYFPEIVCTVFVLNAPMVFTWVYNFVRPFMSAATVQKVRVFGWGEASWGPTLRDAFPAGVLPKEYGGQGAAVLAADGNGNGVLT